MALRPLLYVFAVALGATAGASAQEVPAPPSHVTDDVEYFPAGPDFRLPTNRMVPIPQPVIMRQFPARPYFPLPAAPPAEAQPQAYGIASLKAPTATDHLRIAAEHLAAAGLTEEATRIRRRADQQDVREKLQRKLAELTRLQAEIDELRGLAGKPMLVQVSARILEGSPETRQSLCRHASEECDPRAPETGGAPSAPADPPCPPGFAVLMVRDTEQLMRRVEELVDEDRIRVLGEPRIVATAGRAANVLVGGEFPIPVGPEGKDFEWREFGTRLNTTPLVLASGKLRLELQAEVAEPDFSNAARFGKLVVPGLTTRRMNTTVEMTPGETVVLCGWSTARGNEEPQDEEGSAAKELMILITADHPAAQEAGPAPVELPAGPQSRNLEDVPAPRRIVPAASAADALNER